VQPATIADGLVALFPALLVLSKWRGGFLMIMKKCPTSLPAARAITSRRKEPFSLGFRTGLALMGFGFVVARFGLFLQALQIGQPNLPLEAAGFSPWFGTALILLGVIVNVWSTRAHIRLVRELKRGQSEFARASSLAMSVAAALAALGLAMAIYLLSIREPRQTQLRKIQEKSMISNSENGIVSILSHQPVDQTVQKLNEILRTKGVKLFALIDHSGEAEKAGMQMRPTKLLIFGNPKAGTPLMIASPSIAIDLPPQNTRLGGRRWQGLDLI
jgi:uncharacterized membrane protein YidH (DUF202 family)